MPLPAVPRVDDPQVAEYLKTLNDALQHGLYAAPASGGVSQEAMDDAIQAAVEPLQAQIDAALGTAAPPGTIVAYGGATAPTGWLVCEGQAVPKATYPALFNAIGGAYGLEDAVSFSLPDLRGRMARGADGDLGGAGGADQVTLPVPGHTHQYDKAGAATGVAEGNAVVTPLNVLVPPVTQTPTPTDLNDPAADTVTVTNPYLALLYIIKT